MFAMWLCLMKSSEYIHAIQDTKQICKYKMANQNLYKMWNQKLSYGLADPANL